MYISNSEEKINFLKSLFEETYISDIVGRHNVRNRAELEELLNNPRQGKDETGAALFDADRRFLQEDYHHERCTCTVLQ